MILVEVVIKDVGRGKGHHAFSRVVVRAEGGLLSSLVRCLHRLKNCLLVQIAGNNGSGHDYGCDGVDEAGARSYRIPANEL